jgi:hypothetical protein
MDRKHETAARKESPRRFFVDHFLLLQERLQLSQWPQQAEVPQLHLPDFLSLRMRRIAETTSVATARRIRISERFISEAPLRFFTSFRTTQTIRTVSR